MAVQEGRNRHVSIGNVYIYKTVVWQSKRISASFNLCYIPVGTTTSKHELPTAENQTATVVGVKRRMTPEVKIFDQQIPLRMYHTQQVYTSIHI